MKKQYKVFGDIYPEDTSFTISIEGSEPYTTTLKELMDKIDNHVRVEETKNNSKENEVL